MIANVTIIGKVLKPIKISSSYDESEFGYKFQVETQHTYADDLPPRKTLHDIYCIPRMHWEKTLCKIKPHSYVYIYGTLEYKRNRQYRESYILVQPFCGQIDIIGQVLPKKLREL